ncbi:FHA domain-containing protein [Wenzhouxiangella sp. AB-CW3]|uniref:FHA domain-containing protein n=1 Tax=Wenzhouxiangella sp. AB-CW3 TaxID=2771012 RepID=UPI00168BFE57|nr:FHA domain-containing protein [Wenzhouxiangella sp. AB-CW3]QOC23118.1 FHA domain-containing protein [Wenzhouxiangella sp. AB-CW3]
MSSKEQESKRRPRHQRDAGPQGTQVFSREEVGKLLDEAVSDTDQADGAELRGVSESVHGQSYALAGNTMVVGRSPDCGIRIEEASVSSEHARLVRDDDGWRVVNLLSTNGTFVNDRKISNAAIKDGDHVRFGRAEFVFHDADHRIGSGGQRNFKSWWPLAVAAAAIIGLAVVFLLL